MENFNRLKGNKMAEIGIEFTTNDGKKDWYDPVDEVEFDSNQSESEYIFYTGGYECRLLKSDVKTIRKYQLCPECRREIDEESYDGYCYKCSD